MDSLNTPCMRSWLCGGHKARLSADYTVFAILFYTHFISTVYYNASECVHVHVDMCNLAAGTFRQEKWTYTVFDCDMPAATRLHINYKDIMCSASGSRSGRLGTFVAWENCDCS